EWEISELDAVALFKGLLHPITQPRDVSVVHFKEGRHMRRRAAREHHMLGDLAAHDAHRLNLHTLALSVGRNVNGRGCGRRSRRRRKCRLSWSRSWRGWRGRSSGSLARSGLRLRLTLLDEVENVVFGDAV